MKVLLSNRKKYVEQRKKAKICPLFHGKLWNTSGTIEHDSQICHLNSNFIFASNNNCLIFAARKEKNPLSLLKKINYTTNY